MFNRQQITIEAGGVFHDPVVEEIVRKKGALLKEQGINNSRHFAMRNLPALEGDSYANYMGDLKAGHEELAADINRHLQTRAHMPEGKMDIDHKREVDKEMENKIQDRKHRNENLEHQLGNYIPGSVPLQILIVGIVTGAIAVTDSIFNTKAWQITGESILFAFLLSTGSAVAVFSFSHIAPFLYKAARTSFQKRLALWGSLAFATSFFIVFSIFRSRYLANHDVQVSPLWFVIVNLFLFVVSAATSLFCLPSWAEVKESAHKFMLWKNLQNGRRKLDELTRERERMKEELLARNMLRVRITHYANDTNEKIRKMCRVSMENFKVTNLSFRPDRRVPDCYSEPLPEPDIPDFIFYNVTSNKK